MKCTKYGKWLVVALVMGLFWIASGESAYAIDGLTEEQEKYLEEFNKNNPVIYDEGEEASPGYSEGRYLRGRGDQALPPKYNVAANNGPEFATPVKNQGTLGICWAYTSVALTEQALLLETGTEYDLSERYVDYLMADNATGVSGQNPFAYGTRVIGGGGNTTTTGAYYTQDQLPVRESDFSVTGTDPVSLDLLKKKSVIDAGSFAVLPSINSDAGVTDTERAARVAAIKTLIMDNGGVAYNYNTWFASTNYETGGIYSDAYLGVNHGCALIGWDNSYSRTNFDKDPGVDGAFLMKNSWGTSYVNGGYFYVSYNDANLLTEIFSIYDVSETKDFDNSYLAGNTYGLYWSYTNSSSSQRDYYFSSDFTIDKNKNESITDVLISGGQANAAYEVYLNPASNERGNLSDLQLVAKGTKQNIGAEKIKLQQAVPLTSDDEITMIVKYSVPAGQKCHMLIEQVYNSAPTANFARMKYTTSLGDDGNFTWRDIGITQEINKTPVMLMNVYTKETSQTVPVTGVTVSPTSKSLTVGGTQQLTATVVPTNATNKNVTWSSSNTSVATVSSSGLVTAKAAGTATITVKTADGNKTATSAITVTNPTIAVTGVTLSPTIKTLDVGATQQLTATVAPTNATNKNVTWTSSNSTVASVSSTGLVTAKAAGTATITVRTADGDKTATCAISVTNPTIAVTGVTLSPTSKSLTVNDTQQLTATVAPSNATNKNLVWSSSNSIVASVSSSGLVTAKVEGTATITVRTADGNKIATCAITVTNPTVAVTDIAVSPASKILEKNTAQQLTATITPTNATNKNVTWSSSNTNVATVSSNGLVTAKIAGNATITAKSADGSKTAISTITVDDHGYTAETATTAAINSTTSGNLTYSGDWDFFKVTLSSAGTYKFYSESDNNTDVYGHLYDQSLKELAYNDDGNSNRQFKIEKELAAGIYYFKVRGWSSSTGTYRLKIDKVDTTVAVTGVTVSPTSKILEKNATQQMTATITPTNATNKNVTWSSSNNNIASVTSNGLVTARFAGTATITAKTTDGSKTAASTITVDDHGYTKETATSIGINSITSGNLTYSGDWDFFKVTIPATGTFKFYSESDNNTDTYGHLYDQNLTELAYNDDGNSNRQFKIEKELAAGTYYFKVRGWSSSTGTYRLKIDKAAATVPVTGVGVSPASKTLEKNAAQQLTATITPTNATNKNVTWSSSNNNVASVSSTGLVTAKTAGATIVTVRTVDGSITSSSVITVDDHGYTKETATTVAVNSTTNGNLAYSGDWDFFKVTISTAGTYKFYSESDNKTDVYGHLYDQNLSELAYNDDGNGNLQFKIERNLAAGTYYFKVRGWSTRTGTYRFKIDKIG